MELQPKEVFLRDGRRCVLRSVGPEDAAALLHSLRQAFGETPFLLRAPEEVVKTEEEEADFLRTRLADPRALLAAAFVDGRLAGNAGIECVADCLRCRHRAEFGISVLREFWGLGLGTALLCACVDAARKANYEQVELEVVAGNSRARALYEKHGFVLYGTREHAMRYQDGSYAAEHLMLLRL